MRTEISPRLAISTLPNTRASPPTWSRATGSHPALSRALVRAREGRRVATCYASRRRYLVALLQRASPARPLWRRPPPWLERVRSSKRNVSVPAGRTIWAFGTDHLEGLDQVWPRLARVYDIVYEAHLCCDHRVVELLFVVLDEPLAFGFRVFGLRDLAPEDDSDGGGRAHHRDLTRGPRDVHVGPDVLGAHDVIGPAVSLSGDDRHLGHRGLRESVEQLRPVTDYAPPLLVRAWQKAWHVNERKKRDVEGVAEAYEPGALHARVHVERPSEHGRLVPDDADGPPIEPSEADDEVLGPALLNLEELPVVDHSLYRTSNVVGALGGVGDQTRQVLVHPLRVVGRPEVRGALQIVLGQEGEQVAHVVEAGLLVGRREVGYARPSIVGGRAAEVLEGNVLAGDALYDVGARDEHVARLLDHEHEVRDGRRVHSAARAGSDDDGDLGHHARG